MKSKLIMGMMLTLLLIGMLTLAFNIQPVKASGTIYIKVDGSVDPPTAPISSVDNITYTFTGNIYESIVVQRDNIVVDGAGYRVQGAGSGTGIDLSYRNNVTLKNVKITNFTYGIRLYYSSNNNLTGNTASNKMYGIYLDYSSSNNVLTGNTASNNMYGIYLYCSIYNSLTGNTASNNNYGIYIYPASRNNNLTGNTASNNNYGIYLYQSRNNTIYHNNFINNTIQAVVTAGYVNTWDDGYPSGGNYWSDYTGNDTFSDPYQNEIGSDGIGDTPYVIDADNIDHYPLMYTWGSPKIVILSPQNLTYATSSVPLTFTVDKPASWIGYSLDNQANVTITGNTTLTGLALGPHNMVVYANDTYGSIGFSDKVYFTIAQSQPAVGGIYIPVNKLELLAPYFGLTILLAVAVATVAYVKKRRCQRLKQRKRMKII